MRHPSRDYSLLNTAFGYHPDHDEGDLKPGFGFGTDYGGGPGLKRIYKLWFIQNHKTLVSKEDEIRYLSDEHIILFIEEHPLITEGTDTISENDDPSVHNLLKDLTTQQQVAIFKRSISKDPQLRSLFFSLSKANESSTTIEYTDYFINAFLNFMELRGSRATHYLYGDQHDVMMSPSFLNKIFEGSLTIGENLKRFIHIKVRGRLKLDKCSTNLKVTMPSSRAKENMIDIPRSSLPHISLVADTLWQARIDRGLLTTEVSELISLPSATLHDLEIGTNPPNGYALNRLLALYGRSELIHDRVFMAGILRIDRTHNPVGYELMLARFAHGSTALQVEKALGFTARTVKRYERKQNLPPEDILLKLLTYYDRLDLYDDDTFVAPYMKIDKTKLLFAYQLKLARLKKGWTASKVEAMLVIRAGTLHTYESGTCVPNVIKLNKLLTAYGREDLLDNTAFMQTLIEANSEQLPLAYLLQVERYRRGWVPDQLAEASGVKSNLIDHLEAGNTSCTYDDLRALLLQLGKTNLLQDPNFMAKITLIEETANKSDIPLGHQLKITRIDRGLLTTDILTSSDLNSRTIHQIETGELRQFTPAILNKALKAYGRTDFFNNVPIFARVLEINPDQQIFSFELRLRRFLKIWMPQDLATAAKVGITNISKWENGYQLHTAAYHLISITSALGWQISDSAKLLYRQLHEDPKRNTSKPARAQTLNIALNAIRPHLVELTHGS